MDAIILIAFILVSSPVCFSLAGIAYLGFKEILFWKPDCDPTSH